MSASSQHAPPRSRLASPARPLLLLMACALFAVFAARPTRAHAEPSNRPDHLDLPGGGSDELAGWDAL